MRADTIHKLKSLIPMLGSEHVGEVSAAAATIQKVLAREGLDLHDLANAATGGKQSHAGDDRAWDHPDESAEDTDEDFTAMFRFIYQYNPPKGHWAEMIKSIHDQFHQNHRLSVKQANLVRKFYQTAKEKAARKRQREKYKDQETEF